MVLVAAGTPSRGTRCHGCSASQYDLQACRGCTLSSLLTTAQASSTAAAAFMPVATAMARAAALVQLPPPALHLLLAMLGACQLAASWRGASQLQATTTAASTAMAASAPAAASPVQLPSSFPAAGRRLLQVRPCAARVLAAAAVATAMHMRCHMPWVPSQVCIASWRAHTRNQSNDGISGCCCCTLTHLACIVMHAVPPNPNRSLIKRQAWCQHHRSQGARAATFSAQAPARTAPAPPTTAAPSQPAAAAPGASPARTCAASASTAPTTCTCASAGTGCASSATGTCAGPAGRRGLQGPGARCVHSAGAPSPGLCMRSGCSRRRRAVV